MELPRVCVAWGLPELFSLTSQVAAPYAPVEYVR